MLGDVSSVQAAGVMPGRLALERAELGPFAYTHFCVRYPRDCTVQGAIPDGQPGLELTQARRTELAGVNSAVNRTIVPAAHAGRGTFDTWTISPARGDCNDYAVTKRHELLARGWPSAALLLAEVITPWGEHHLVLVARTRDADLVLDNLASRVRDWRETGYVWLRAQMPTEPALWAHVAAPERPVASRSPVLRADIGTSITQ